LKTGCCINYFIGFDDERMLEKALEYLKACAESQGWKVVKYSITPARKTLAVNPHPRCETVVLDFMKVKDWRESGEHMYYDEIAKETRESFDRTIPKFYPFVHDEMWYSADFTKTEYAPKSNHVKVCSFLRSISTVATLFRINDESGYYGSMSKRKLLEGHGYLAGEKVNDLQTEADSDG